MIIEFGGWQLRPMPRCWSVFSRQGPDAKEQWREFGRYYADLADAFLFCAQQDMRAGRDVTDLVSAMEQYERLCERIEDAAQSRGNAAYSSD